MWAIDPTVLAFLAFGCLIGVAGGFWAFVVFAARLFGVKW